MSHNLIVGAGTIGAGVLGVAFQSVLSHQMHPSDYGAVFAVVTLITLVGLPATAFTLLMARETSRGLASGQLALSSTTLSQGSSALIYAGLVVAAVLATASRPLGSYLGVQPALLLAAAAGLPFGVALPLFIGEFQGEQRFGLYSVFGVGQAALKLVAAIGLGLVLGPLGVILGISLATAAVYLLARVILRRKLALRPTMHWLGPAARYLAVIVPSTLALSVLLSADVFVVKHYFPTRIAGEYAAVAALGRAVFWGASAVATVLFPKVVFRGTKGLGRSQLVNASLLIVVVGGGLALGMVLFASTPILAAFAGPAYAAGATYLPWYAVGMTLLGGVAVLIAVHQSRGKPGFLLLLLPLMVAEPIALVAFHGSLWQVVQVVDVSMALLFFALAALYVVEERFFGPTHAAGQVGVTALQVIGRVGADR